ncbi:MAG: hypothetical protein HY810_03170 [Candidatus Omnitrophica bacterium]|nr:hypothetical protein [Candidatus Omnitrophota bacterium]
MHSFKKHAVFEQINELSQQLGLKVYLVGGAVREIFLKRRQGKKIDWDFAVSSKSEAFSKKLAEKLRAPCIVLDKKKRTFRVIWRYGDQEHVFDFTDFRGKNLRADLKGRDFTINTLCLDIALLVKKKPEKKVVIDYFNARSDIIRFPGKGLLKN